MIMITHCSLPVPSDSEAAEEPEARALTPPAGGRAAQVAAAACTGSLRLQVSTTGGPAVRCQAAPAPPGTSQRPCGPAGRRLPAGPGARLPCRTGSAGLRGGSSRSSRQRTRTSNVVETPGPSEWQWHCGSDSKYYFQQVPGSTFNV